LLHQFRHGANRFLDGNVRIHAMLEIEIDRLDAQPQQACFTGLLHIFRAPADAKVRSVGGTNIPEFCGQHGVLAASAKSAAH